MRSILLAMVAWALTAAVSYGQYGRVQQDKPVKSAAKAKPTTAKTGEAAYEDLPEPWRGRFIKDWKAYIDQENARLLTQTETKSKAKSGSAAAAQRKKDLYGTRKFIAKLKKNVPPYFKRLSFAVGDYGRTDYNPHVVQVLPPDKVLVTIDQSVGNSTKEHWVMLKVASTEGMTDGQMLNGMLIHITGTTTYATVAGATNTVFVAEQLDLDSLKKEPAVPKDEENKIEKGLPDRASDTRILLGRWQVSVMDYRGIWTFRQDGVVLSSTSSPGRWSIEGEIVHITWSPKFWESFHRPLDPLHTTGDSWKGPDKLIAVKVK